MIMHTRIKTFECKRYVNKRLSHGCVIDDFGCKDFNKGPHGWPLNDLQSLYKATSLQEAQMIMNNLLERPSGSSIPSSVKDADAVMSIRYRYCQSPLELVTYQQEMLMRNVSTTSKQQVVKPAEKSVVAPAEKSVVAPAETE